MKRLLLAVLIAILFHVSIFALNPGWFTRKPDKMRKPAITVTMSYKRKSAPPAPVIKPPPKIKKKKVRVVKKEKKPEPVKVKEKLLEPEPVKEQETVEEAADTEEDVVETVPDEVEDVGEYESVDEGTASEAVSEAVPLYRTNPEPRYPNMARKRGYQGTVLLSVHVNKEGKVDDLWLYESCGYKILDNAALKAVKDWTHEPGKRGEKAIETWVEVPVIFKLK